MKKTGDQLRVGDVIETWWPTCKDRIVGLRSDAGRWDRRIATLEHSKVEMPIEYKATYKVRP